VENNDVHVCALKFGVAQCKAGDARKNNGVQCAHKIFALHGEEFWWHVHNIGAQGMHIVY
jgi:hypothetical protein